MWSAVADSKGVVIASLCALAFAAALGRTRQVADPPGCPIAQSWSDGDQHFWETVELNGEGFGVWTSGGFAEEAEHAQRAFKWTRTDDEMTFRFSGADQRPVRYKLESRGSYCTLDLEPTPFACGSPRTLHLSNLGL